MVTVSSAQLIRPFWCVVNLSDLELSKLEVFQFDGGMFCLDRGLNDKPWDLLGTKRASYLAFFVGVWLSLDFYL